MRAADPARLANLAAAVALDLATAVDAAVASATGLTAAEGRALTALANLADGRSIEVLRQTIGLSQPGCARLVDRLVAAGQAVRSRPVDDRRVVHVALPHAGRATVGTVLAARRAAVERRLGVLPPRQAAELERLLTLLAAAAIDEPADANGFCRGCDPDACGHPDRCPTTAVARRLAAAAEPPPIEV